ncbi:MAG: Ktr system potassium uptake protein B [Lentisphaerae bacterium ADurb.Bin242]|nr:MAG: Ktr system potassium uptake protein B [Lentisphaerae bacterium ADurb.Bin242]
MNPQNKKSRRGFLEGMLLVLSPVPMLFASPEAPFDSLWARPEFWFGAAASVLCFLCVFTLFLEARIGKAAGALSVLCAAASLVPAMAARPPLALLGLIAGISGVVFFSFLDTRKGRALAREQLFSQRVAGAGTTMFALMLVSIFFTHSDPYRFQAVLVCCGLFASVLYGTFAWCFFKTPWKYVFTVWSGISGLLVGGSLYTGHLLFVSFVLVLPMIPWIVLFFTGKGEFGLEILLNHPARLLFSTFLLLCLSGTLLLSLPISTHKGISVLDAAFTAVSASCVTGLVVLDTGKDFTGTGQGFILLLIQLGGLGIMSIASVALYSIGRRLSLTQEHVMNRLTELEGDWQLFEALVFIFKFTFLVELAGGLILTVCFMNAGLPFGNALWEGIFTAVAAFCNAGFSLRGENLVRFQGDPLILYTVSVLIILGGLSPLVSLSLPRWLAGKTVPHSARLVFITTAVLLLSGTFGILAFEWNGILKGLGIGTKISNAWFQAVTLRTAGFNSLDLGGISAPTFLLMVFMMFVGGSPGSTAGGIKTTVLAVLALTFWNNILNREEIVVMGRRIPPRTVFKAVTIAGAFGLIFASVVFMLLMTQNLPARLLVFETGSALGTVGLSMNATGLLDEIGRVLIMLTMFIGRVGPITLFMLLSGTEGHSKTVLPDVKIPLS